MTLADGEVVRENIDMPLLKYFTLAVALSRVAAEGPCVDEPGATLPGGWDCARIAEYIAGSDVHSCSWAGPWLSVMVAPQLAEEAAKKCPLSCNECAPDDVDAVDDRVEDNGSEEGLAKDDPAYAPEAPGAPTTEGEPDSTTHPLPTPKSGKCPKPYTQSGPFCCFGPPMAPECYKWSD